MAAHVAGSVRQLYSRSLCRAFPPVECAFAYGSAVFQQQGRAMGKMLDLVFVVGDSKQWHEENMKRNHAHYSFMKWLGPSTVSLVQRAPAGVYYNPLVTVDTQLVKYGVISTKDLLTDLLQWKWLYVSGRLHKPVLMLSPADKWEELERALYSNRAAAVVCAGILLGRHGFTMEQLFMEIAGLSFKGDFRMTIGEDKNKVANIVLPNMKEFHKLYEPHLSLLLEPAPNRSDLWQLKGGVGESDLPRCVRDLMDRGVSLDNAVATIVGSSSKLQSAKGILTAGITRTMVYSYEKLMKMFKSMR